LSKDGNFSTVIVDPEGSDYEIYIQASGGFKQDNWTTEVAMYLIKVPHFPNQKPVFDSELVK
jgi:hypothetical protein